MRAARGWARAHPGALAILSLGFAWALFIHSMGWAQLAHFGQVRALAAGQAEMTPWHWETGDVAWIDEEYYSVKSPGTAALATPVFLGLEAVGFEATAEEIAMRAREATSPRWVPNAEPPYSSYGYDGARAAVVEARVERNTPTVWVLTLFAAVVPSIALLFGVRRVAERLEPGYGTAAAVTLGVATVLMVFAAEFFSHAISAALGFAAFMVLMRERAGPPSPVRVGLAGLLAGLAVTFEFQVGLVGVVLFFYALGAQGRLRRALAYGAGAIAGTLPAFAFNAWAFGDPLKLAYSDAVEVIGRSGHDQLGLNDDGFFGITVPRPDAAFELLFASRGVLVLTPVLLAAAVGVYLMRKRGHRAEASVIAGVAAAYFIYNAGYWQPYGGGTPGPRFLVPTLPFLALGLAFAWKRMPALTAALAIPSALWMVAASLTFPLIGDHGTGTWVEQLTGGELEHTVLTALGVKSNWLAALPVLLAIGAAIWFAAIATPRLVSDADDVRWALRALAAWVVVSIVGPTLSFDPATPLDDGSAALAMIAVAALAALVAVLALRRRIGEEEAASAPARTEAEPVRAAP